MKGEVLTLLLLSCPSLAYSGAFFWDITGKKEKIQRKWETPKIRWRYNPDNAPADAQSIIQKSFLTWQTETSAAISDIYSGTTALTAPKLDGYSDIFFNVDMSTIGSDSSLIAVTLLNSTKASSTTAEGETIVEADILINPKKLSSLITTIPTSASDLDLQEILTHEIGHAYGLAHSFLIDSMMYPSKPPTSARAEFKALFRVPKRSLAQDDIAWMEMLYPSGSTATNSASISGRILLDGEPFIGAQVIALKSNEADLDFRFYPPETGENFVAKGLQNIAAFTEENGAFLISGLKPGDYRVAVQNASGFMGFELSNINEYLSAYRSSDHYPLTTFQTSDCTSFGSTTGSNFSSAYSTATEFSITGAQSYCGLEINATTGGNICATSGTQQNICENLSNSSGDGCRIQATSQRETLGILIFVTLFIGSCFIFRRRSEL